MGSILIKLTEKIFSGKDTCDEDWTDYLIETHTKAPGKTVAAFADHKTDIGGNTYELIASCLDQIKGRSCRILDLACGDGFLSGYLKDKMGANSSCVGVDMVPAEIERATVLRPDQRFTYEVSKAQDLSFVDEEFDFVFCHLALMLMLPLEPVLKEISRVTKRQGIFSFIIGKNINDRQMFEAVGKATATFVNSKLSEAGQFKIGDERLNDIGLTAKLLQTHGFQILEKRDFTLLISGSTRKVWDSISNFHLINLLPKEERSKLKKIVVADLEAKAEGGDQVVVPVPFRLIEAKKIG
jgi:ubiquinone/menaquinone biosynthesis C-methylase UbiE